MPSKDAILNSGGSSGGGGYWRVVGETIDTVPSGSTGNILMINAPDPETQLVRLRFLTAAAGVEGGISLSSDGNSIWSNVTLGSGSVAPNPSLRCVSSNGFIATSTTNDSLIGVIKEVVGKQIIISKNAGGTAQILNYAYEILEKVQ